MSNEASDPPTEQVVSSKLGDYSSSQLANVYVGTAGFSYVHWRKGIFYPRNGVTQQQELRHFSGVFSAVEINASFHGVPRLETLTKWASLAKKGFVFSFKVPQAITHESGLEHIRDALTFFINRLEEGMCTTVDPKNPGEGDIQSANRLGPILFQLPPTLHKSLDRLHEIAEMVPQGLKVAFEFRHKSWYTEEVYDELQKHKFGLCENISPDNSTLHVNRTTAKTWHYTRLHKKSDRDVTNYSDEQLSSIADQIMERRQQNVIQYIYLLNDHEGNGPRNAKTLLKYIKERSGNASFVHNWRPDAIVPSIQSLFKVAAKRAKGRTPSEEHNKPLAKKARKDDVEKAVGTTKKSSITSFFLAKPK